MFEETKKQLEEALESAEKLVNAEKHDTKNLKEANIIPKDIGVYLWRSKTSDEEIVYVGSAFGENGLYQRIIEQHLYDNYRKSVFRKQIAKENRLEPKDEVSFIENHFVLSFIRFDKKDEKIAHLVEILLINEFSPKYNREGKYSKNAEDTSHKFADK